MRAWQVDYSGMWLGGTAIVLAESEDEALRLVEQHPGTVCSDRETWKNAKATEITMEGVLYNWNGDY